MLPTGEMWVDLNGSDRWMIGLGFGFGGRVLIVLAI